MRLAKQTSDRASGFTLWMKEDTDGLTVPQGRNLLCECAICHMMYLTYIILTFYLITVVKDGVCTVMDVQNLSLAEGTHGLGPVGATSAVIGNTTKGLHCVFVLWNSIPTEED